MVRRRTPKRKKRTTYHTLGPSLGAAPAKKNGAWVILVLGALVVVNLYVFVWDKKTSVGAIKREAESRTAPAAALPSQPLDGSVPRPLAAGAAASDRNRTTLPAAAAPVGPPGTIEGKVGKSDTLG